MPTRSGCLYLANSMNMRIRESFGVEMVPSPSETMVMEIREPSGVEMVPSLTRKRKRHPERELRILDMNLYGNLPQLRCQRKSKEIHKTSKKFLPKNENDVRCSKKLKGTSNTYETAEKTVVLKSRKRGRREIGCEIDNDLEGKMRRSSNQDVHDKNFIDVLPEDLVVEIMMKFSASATSPSDIINARLVCKKFNDLVQRPCVLTRASARSLSVRAELWSESAHQFLKMCAHAGNLEAHYMLGMIYFYCKNDRRGGAAYMAKAAMGSHPSALYSLAIIQFNGSGGSKSDKNLSAGIALCVRAAHLGHINAIRELGYCLQDGYGIRCHVEQGRRYLCAATNLELHYLIHHLKHLHDIVPRNAKLLSDIYLRLKHAILDLDPHPVNRFLVDWWKSRAEAREDGFRACSHVKCGRIETRQHEFRRCSVCGKANYCSRACQAMDWKRSHQEQCVPPPVPEGPPVGLHEEQFVAQLAADLA